MLEVKTVNHKRQLFKEGFTLIELITVIVIIGLLAAAGVHLANRLINSFQYSIYRKDLSEGAQVALRRIAREIRRLKNQTSVIIANTGAYRFNDNDDATIQFQLNGTDIEREYSAATDVLAADVSSFIFTYLDDHGSYISAPLVSPQKTDIKFVELNMIVSSDSNAIDYKTKIRLRNVRKFSDLFP